MIAFFVAGIPKAMSVGKGIRVPNKGGGWRQFQTRSNAEWATLVGHVGREHAPAAPWDGPIVLDVCFFVPRPDSASKRVVLPLKRPDFDNLFHKLTDQWNGVYWRDDSQIVDCHLRKRFPTGPSGRIGALFRIHVMTPAELKDEIVEHHQAELELAGR